ncbi:MAG: hypothetical protein IKF52_03020 [Clostridia bacterium]|nr:hypothetical protein [Clostridia bacterium]
MRRKAFFSVFKKHVNLDSFLEKIKLLFVVYFAVLFGFSVYNSVKTSSYSEEEYRRYELLAKDMQESFDNSDYSGTCDVSIVISPIGKNPIKYDFLTQNITTLQSANGFTDNLVVSIIGASIAGALLGFFAGKGFGEIVKLLLYKAKKMKKQINDFKEEMNQEMKKMT